MTPTNGHTQETKTTTPFDLYASSALQGMLANPNNIIDYEKTSSAAMRWAEAMTRRRSEMERHR